MCLILPYEDNLDRKATGALSEPRAGRVAGLSNTPRWLRGRVRHVLFSYAAVPGNQDFRCTQLVLVACRVKQTGTDHAGVDGMPVCLAPTPRQSTADTLASY